MKIGKGYIRKMLAVGILPTLFLTGCMGDEDDSTQTDRLDGKAHLVLTFVTPSDGTSTRSAAEDPDGYETGIGYENTVDINGGDYRMYFFTYSSGDEKGGTLIAEFKPDEITSVSSSSTTTYTVKGDVPNELMDVGDFRVVMLANWGMWYPSVTAGTTTIDDLCEGEYTTFNAFKKFVIDEYNLIPFYGVQEYSNVLFTIGKSTTLTTPVSLLRAVAKVEVILTAASEVDEFSGVSIVNYNSQGYNAPAGVYTAADYDTEMKNNPSSDNWPDEWVKDLHLVGGANDLGSKTQTFTQIIGADQDTWRIYLPEYNNMGTDYSYISVTIGGEEYNIYFAEYNDDGTTDNTDRYNIKRNNLYRFYVTYEDYFRVYVNKWDEIYENDFNFDSDYVSGESGNEGDNTEP